MYYSDPCLQSTSPTQWKWVIHTINGQHISRGNVFSELSNGLANFRCTKISNIPEAIIFAPSLTYPTPVVIATYVYPQTDSFGKQEAEIKLNNITQTMGGKFSYLDTITVDGEPAYEYRSYDPNGNAARNIILRKGAYVYYIQGYEDEKNLWLLIQSFHAKT